ncbi:MAG: c-type cytochrome [Bacteroidia bacterium]|nr:c-type cytochrome [Bacteroidia bacterium]
MVTNTIIFTFLTLTIASCGPRTGIHEETSNEEPIENIVVEQISPIEKSEQNGRKIFKQNCSVCHDIATMKFTGPGLGGVLDRLPKPSEEYFIKYITNNDSLLKKDLYAKKLRIEYQDIDVNHDFNYLTASDKQDLIVYLKTWDRPIPQIIMSLTTANTR